MNKLSIVAGLLPVAAFAGVTGNWSNTSGESTPVSRLTWTTPGNWEGESVPQTSDDTASFTKYAMPDATVARWIDLPTTMDVKKIGFSSASGPLRLIGGTLGLTDGVSASSGEMRLYADIKASPASSVPSFAYADVCGDFASDMKVETSAGYLRHRLDLYANAAGEVRTNPMTTYVLQPSRGHFSMIAPQGSGQIKAVWRLQNGSALAVRPNATAAHVLCAGTTVTSVGGELAAGTFLRRIFDDGTIELSAPASFTGDDREVELTFAAFSPKVTQKIDQINHFGIDCSLNFAFSKYRAEDSLRVTFDHLSRPGATTDATRESRRVTFGCETDYPGTVIVRNTQSVKVNVVLENCHLEFAMPPEQGYSAGFPVSASVRQARAENVSTLTVSNNITAYIPALTNVVGTLVKDGEGTLVVGLTNAVTAAGDIVNTGTLDVREGTFTVRSNGETGLPAVRSLSLSKSARMVLPAEGLKVHDLTYAVGATISGGTVYTEVPVDAAGLVLEDGARVVCVTHDGVVRQDVVASVVSNVPAFWVDVANADSFVTSEESGTKYILRWHDTRETDVNNPKYLFATNVGSVHAKLATQTGTDGGALTYVLMDNQATTDPSLMEHLVWSAPFKNIRAVFMVRDPGIYSGQALLGATKRLPSGRREDFRRNSANGKNIEAALFHSGCHSYVQKGKHYINGEPVTWNGYYPYGKYTSGSDAWLRPLVQEVHTSGDCMADCFGALYPGDTSYTSFNGYDSICECIVYTNVLTETERLGIEQYLMRKWVKADISADRFEGASKTVETLTLDGDASYGIAAGSRVNVGSLTGEGVLEKQGAGALYVDRVQDGSISLDVSAGEMIVRSVKPDRDALPDGVYIHLDASDEDSLGKELKADGETYGLATWGDCRGVGHLTATASTTNRPTVASVLINGQKKQVIDFGPLMNSSKTLTSLGSATSMTFANCKQVRSMAIVIGSRQGGGAISGSTQSSSLGGLKRGNFGASASDGLYSTGGGLIPRYVTTGQYQNSKPGGTSWRLNGQEVKATTTGLSGTFDLVTIRTPDAFAVNALSAYSYAFYCGGQEIAEIIYWERMLSLDEMRQVEAYLAEKWFGTARTADYDGATVGALTVAKDAQLTVEGGSPVVVSSLSGAGTVRGGIAFSANAEVVLPVADDGSTDPLTASSACLPAALTVRLTGEKVRRLSIGRHVVLAAPGIETGCSCQLTLANAPQNRSCSLKVVDGAVVLDVDKLGLAIIVR